MGGRATTASIVINERRWAEEALVERRGEEKLRGGFGKK